KGYVPDGAGTPFSGIQNAGAVSGLVPMLLNPITEDELEVYLLDDKWFVQEKLDGKRIMIRIEGGKVTASNRKGLVVGIPTEVENDLSNLI
ncbi:hypothetical protein, partial [Klebsiella pneumoniae]|uniref:hypothetical protein n=1 Tax=Klebsiella pneumoniae TaxID=573 RepID=UPI003EE14252